MTPAEQAAHDLMLVIDYWPGLAVSRHPDVRMPRRETTLTPDRRAELDHEARIEREERIDIAPGEHIDAVRADVLDMMADLLITADDIATRVAADVWHPPLLPLDHPSTAFADPGPWLHYAATRIADAEPDTIQDVRDQARGLVAMLTTALSLSCDGQRLAVLCPWCHGAILGDRTLRVRALPGGLIGITCEFSLCSPPLGDVGTWWHGHPVWPLHMWPWLAKRIAKAPPAQQRPAMTYPRPLAEPDGIPAILAGCRRADSDGTWSDDDTADLA